MDTLPGEGSDRESSEDLMQRSRRVGWRRDRAWCGYLGGKDRRRMGWSLALGLWDLPRAWDGGMVVCDGFRSFC